MATSAIIIASFSLVLYTCLAVVSFYQASKFWDFKLNQIYDGLYYQPKFLFFIVLGISACFNLPIYIACLALNGPSFCVWKTDSYNATYDFYLIGTCGFIHSIISTSVLWSDLIQRKDGLLWFSTSLLCKTKIFFRICFIIYVTIVLAIMIMDVSDSYSSSDYRSSNIYKGTNFCLYPIFTFFITCGSLYSGTQLQRYLLQGDEIKEKYLFKLNLTMALIVCSYFLRALIIFSLWKEVSISYQNAFHVFTNHYPVFLSITDWIPFIFCSILLVISMRFRTNNSNMVTISTNNNNDINTINPLNKIFDPRTISIASTGSSYDLHDIELTNPSSASILDFDPAHIDITNRLSNDHFLTINDLQNYSITSASSIRRESFR